MFTFSFYNQKKGNVCHRKRILFKSYISKISVSSTDIFFLCRRYFFHMFILVLKNSFQIGVSVLYGLLHCFVNFLFFKFLKLPSLHELFRDIRCYIWCYKELSISMVIVS